MQLLALLLPLVGGALASRAGRAGASLSPVTRVVNLLKNLQEKVEEEQKQEEALFIKYKCWAQSVVDSKKASNQQAQSRKDSLETYVADLDAGRIELTTERTDLEKEVNGLTQDIDAAEAMRDKEHEDYVAASTEMTQAIAALDSAIAVLSAATGSPSQLLLLDSKQMLESRVEQGEALNRAIEVGRHVLSRADQEFLEHLLSGEVPIPDWKKLNRKADFKMKYKARSSSILQKLRQLRLQFSGSLGDMDTREQQAASSHQTLMNSKNGQLTTAQDSLSRLSGEGGARGLAKSQAQAEITALNTQLTDDRTIISDVQGALANKTVEWRTRKQLRVDELAAIAKAISILYSDDARDLFKRSLSSQSTPPPSFLQAETELHATARAAETQRQSALLALKQAARVSGDSRLMALVALSAKQGPAHFASVIQAIDNMVAQLQAEETTDLQTKEDCESTRANDTRAAAVTSRNIDELSDTITRLEQEIAEHEAEIQNKKDEIVQITQSLAAAKEVRDAEHAEWLKTDADDAEAARLVGQAKVVLEDFYSQHQSLLQQKQAPPPPPPTWDAPYSGKQEENKGIVGILQLIQDDINNDRQKAHTAETDAASAYASLETVSQDNIRTLQSEITALEQTVSGKKTDKSNADMDRGTQKGELEAILDKMKRSAPACDFYTINYETRVRNRQKEMDGLTKAKVILSGANLTLVQINRHS